MDNPVPLWTDTRDFFQHCVRQPRVGRIFADAPVGEVASHLAERSFLALIHGAAPIRHLRTHARTRSRVSHRSTHAPVSTQSGPAPAHTLDVATRPLVHYLLAELVLCRVWHGDSHHLQTI